MCIELQAADATSSPRRCARKGGSRFADNRLRSPLVRNEQATGFRLRKNRKSLGVVPRPLVLQPGAPKRGKEARFRSKGSSAVCRIRPGSIGAYVSFSPKSPKSHFVVKSRNTDRSKRPERGRRKRGRRLIIARSRQAWPKGGKGTSRKVDRAFRSVKGKKKLIVLPFQQKDGRK